MTNEELARYELLDCPSCDSCNTNVRVAGNGWSFVGCMDCWNKKTCDEANIDYCVERWNDYARKCGKVRSRGVFHV